MNHITITGRLGRDPELKTGGNGTEYCKFSVAVDRRKTSKDQEKKTDWFYCTAFGKTAVFIDKYFKKGDGIEIEGRMENDKYTDKETNKERDGWQVKVDLVEFPKGKGGEGSSSSESSGSSAPVDGFQSINEDDIPF